MGKKEKEWEEKKENGRGMQENKVIPNSGSCTG